jgi:hypothetical protein
MIELRWYVFDGERVLQYRVQKEVADYGAVDPTTRDYWKRKEWGPWTNVPEHFPYTAK